MQAPAVKSPKKIELTPAGVHALAEQKKSLDLCQVNLASTTNAYQKCSAEAAPPLAFWQKPAVAIGAPIGAVILTMIVCGFAHCQF